MLTPKHQRTSSGEVVVREETVVRTPALREVSAPLRAQADRLHRVRWPFRRRRARDLPPRPTRHGPHRRRENESRHPDGEIRARARPRLRARRPARGRRLRVQARQPLPLHGDRAAHAHVRPPGHASRDERAGEALAAEHVRAPRGRRDARARGVRAAHGRARRQAGERAADREGRAHALADRLRVHGRARVPLHGPVRRGGHRDGHSQDAAGRARAVRGSQVEHAHDPAVLAVFGQAGHAGAGGADGGRGRDGGGRAHDGKPAADAATSVHGFEVQIVHGSSTVVSPASSLDRSSPCTCSVPAQRRPSRRHQVGQGGRPGRPAVLLPSLPPAAAAFAKSGIGPTAHAHLGHDGAGASASLAPGFVDLRFVERRQRGGRAGSDAGGVVVARRPLPAVSSPWGAPKGEDWVVLWGSGEDGRQGQPAGFIRSGGLGHLSLQALYTCVPYRFRTCLRIVFTGQ
ncbi:hypothetical protein OF83DRAFT_180953 [Amylostereum chailletii]|nr:hypothetical protein OF83DRAFT_180953 [Amylostereum chailletii]